MSLLKPNWLRTKLHKKARQLCGVTASARISFSQEGEDLILAKLLGFENGWSPGFYVDVGAHDPEHFSNTLFFYNRGWQGLNIDAAPGTSQKFDKLRCRDTNLEVAVSQTEGEIDYVIFNNPLLNGCDMTVAQSRNGDNGNKIEKVIKVAAKPLSLILDQYLHRDQKIDFLNVDVEGHDLSVLESNNWRRYRPKLVVVEDALAIGLLELTDSPINRFLSTQGYVMVSRTPLTSFFADAELVQQGQLGIRIL